MRFFRGIVAGSLLCSGISGASSLRAQIAEVTTKEAPVTFKAGVNLVPVPVVVRDRLGHAVGDLGVNDFQLFDNGTSQMISKFTVEKLTAEKAGIKEIGAPAPPAPQSSGTLVNADPDGIPDRFVAYLFDDLHMSPSDLVRTRDAAKHQIDSSLHTLERVAVFTTSGRPMQEFTGDPDKLHAALAALSAGKATAVKQLRQTTCPPVTYYMGDLIYNKNDTAATNIAVTDTMVCENLAPQEIGTAQLMVRVAAKDAFATGDRDTVTALDTLRAVVSRMASMPGQRSIVLVSPGFLVLEDRQGEEMAIIERAVRASVVIGALDARGLFTMTPGGDATESLQSTTTVAAKFTYLTTETTMQSDILGNVTSGTGGTFYKGTNNLDEGFARTAEAPEYLYVLGFSPRDLKLDGGFHGLKVVLKAPKGMSLQVRKGYYAPKYAADPAERAKQRIEETFFSRDEVRDLPAALQTQYFKSENGDATLSAVAKVDVKKLAFHKEGDRNRNDVTVMTGLFDNDGNYVTGVQKVVEMRLLDETLQKRLASGIAVKSSFTVHPGRYVVRMVVFDTEGQLMSAQSSLVVIP